VHDDDVTRGKGEQSRQSVADLVVHLRLHIAALERELAIYGSKYGFTDNARSLLSRSEDG
jgi:hypothetical protein